MCVAVAVFQLYDKINTRSHSPSHRPLADAVHQAREVSVLPSVFISVCLPVCTMRSAYDPTHSPSHRPLADAVHPTRDVSDCVSDCQSFSVCLSTCTTRSAHGFAAHKPLSDTVHVVSQLTGLSLTQCTKPEVSHCLFVCLCLSDRPSVYLSARQDHVVMLSITQTCRLRTAPSGG